MDWNEVLEDDAVEQRGDSPVFDIEAPPGFGRSEYRRMVEDLWSEGEKQRETMLERTLDLMDESIDMFGYGLRKTYEEIISDDPDAEELMAGSLGAAFNSVVFAGAPFLGATQWVENGCLNRLEDPGHTISDNIYTDDRESTGRVFYTEGDERYVTVRPPEPGESLDRELVMDASGYMNKFEA